MPGIWWHLINIRAFDKCPIESSMPLLLLPSKRQISLEKHLEIWIACFVAEWTCDLLSHVLKSMSKIHYLQLNEFFFPFFFLLYVGAGEKEEHVRCTLNEHLEKARHGKCWVGRQVHFHRSCPSESFSNGMAQGGSHLVGDSIQGQLWPYVAHKA